MAREKKTPEAQLQYVVGLASGAGEHMVHDLWSAACGSASELERLGLRTAADSDPYQLNVGASEVLLRLISFTMWLQESRVWNSA